MILEAVTRYLILAAVTILLAVWARRIPRQRVPVWHRTALRVLPSVLHGVVLVSALVTVLAMRHSFHAVSEARPSEKASMLAEGISVIMNAWAVAAAILVAAAIYLALVSWRYRSRA